MCNYKNISVAQGHTSNFKTLITKKIIFNERCFAAYLCKKKL